MNQLKETQVPAVLSAALITDIPNKQPLLFLPSDHLLEKNNVFNKSLIKNSKYLNNKNIFLFGIKPDHPSKEYGYLNVKKSGSHLIKIVKFIEKPSVKKAKHVNKKNWTMELRNVFCKKRFNY